MRGAARGSQEEQECAEARRDESEAFALKREIQALAQMARKTIAAIE
jgi:hypothetical protein